MPKSLEELTPGYLTEVPPDPFDGEPLRYARTDEGYVLYSIGEDGEDDGGKERIDGPTEEGDIIIWPWGPVCIKRPMRELAPSDWPQPDMDIFGPPQGP